MSNSWYEWSQVVQGDTLSSIALRWFGSSEERYWRRIWLANRAVIGEDPNRLASGQWLKLPSYHVILYLIEQGDTLFQLAEWVYGDGRAFWLIQQANPWMTDPDQIQVGWWIKIP
jgi:nucleoid-associated protein YgaU